MNHKSVLLTLFLLLCFSIACKKLNPVPLEFFEVETGIAEATGIGIVKLNGKVKGIDDKVDNIIFGFIYSTQSSTFEVENVDGTSVLKLEQTESLSAERNFDKEISQLPINADLFYRAFAKSGERTVYGRIENFSFGFKISIPSEVPTRENDALELEGVVTGLEELGSNLEDHGHVFSTTNSTPEYNIDSTTHLGSRFRNGSFFSPLSNLDFHQNYFVRAYVLVDGVPIYSDQILQFELEEGWKQLNINKQNNPRPPLKIRGAFANVNPLNNTAYMAYGCGKDCTLAVASNNSGIASFIPLPNALEANYNSVHNCASSQICRARANGVSFFLNDKLYFGLGDLKTENVYLDDFWEYDISNNTFTQMENYPGGPRTQAVSFVLGDTGFVGTGSDGTLPKEDFYRFTPPNVNQPLGTWESIASLSGNCDVIPGRSNAIAFVLNGEGYISTGFTVTCYSHDLWKYDEPNNEWIEIGSLPDQMPKREGASVFTIEDRAYISTGFRISANGQPNSIYNDLWEYCATSQEWEPRTSLPSNARRDAVAFSIDNKGYLGTGWEEQNNNIDPIFDDFWVYYPSRENCQ